MDRHALAGCTAYCPDGTLAGVGDSTGRVCVGAICTELEIRASGHEAMRVHLAQALLLNALALERSASELAPAIVEPWPRKEDRHALAATTNVDSTLLADFERSSLRSAAAWVPGVQWAERGHGGSTRLSIRGSLLRSPYGVRGVKVFWGPFPLTLADGSTPLELLDPITVSSLDIIRSVGSPVYGSAPSGMVLANAPFRTATGHDVAIEGSGGSDGFFRVGAIARNMDAKSAITAGVVRQRNDGYRAQEWSARDQAFITSRLAQKHGTTQMFVTWQNASWALPGSIDSLTAMAYPRSARPYSQLIDAHIEKQQLMGGIATDIALGQHLRVRSGVDAQIIDKKNPFGTSAINCGFKDEAIRAVGVRLSLSGDRVLRKLPIAWEIGLEGLLERDGLVQHSYVNAVMGDRVIDADTRVTNFNVFGMTTTRLSRNTSLFAGFGMERTGYDHNDHLAGTDLPYRMKAAPYPILGIEHTTPYAWKWHLRYAESVSRPTVWELLGSTGIFNASLHSEQVREFEFGVDAGSDGSRFDLGAQAFYRASKGIIQQRWSIDGEDLGYANAGGSNIGGIEAFAQGRSDVGRNWRTLALSTLSVQLTEFGTPDGPDLDATPGNEFMNVGLFCRAVHRDRFSIGTGIHWVGDVRGGGTRVVPAYHVLHMRCGYTLPLRANRLECFIHLENLLDIRYTSWVQVNDPGGRYYNPAPGRSVFGGIRMTFGGYTRAKAD